MFWNRIIANKLRRIDLFFVYRKWYAWKKSVRLFVLGNVKGPSLTTPSNANRVSVRSEEVGGGLPFNATSSFEATGE